MPSHTISLVTSAMRMNTTALNQADHCIVALPQAVAGNVLPTVSTPNQVLDAAFCSRQFGEPRQGLWQFFVQVVAANANQLGGTLPENSFTSGEFAMLPQQYMARSIATVSSTQVAATKMYQVEAIRLSDKLGANNPKAAALAAQAYAGAQTARVMAIQAEAATITPPTAGATTAAVSVRLVNAKGQGLEGYTIGLLRANGTLVETLGRSGASGFFATTYDEAKTAALAREGNLSSRSPTRPERKSSAPRTRSRSIPAPTSARRWSSRCRSCRARSRSPAR